MLKKILKVMQILGIIIVCILLFLAVIQKILPKESGVFGFRTFVIVSRSMEPKLKIGDVILVRQIPPENIKIGDVISYEGLTGDFAGKIITHKVVNIITENKKHIFYTKGDNNELMDPAVYEEQLYGKKVYKAYILSFISKILRNTFGFIFLVATPLIILFIKEVQEIRSEIKERRK